MKSDVLSKTEICGYCGSRIMWNVDDKNFKFTKKDLECEDDYDYIVYCSNPKCKYHKHEYIFDMENPSFCLYNVEQEQLERKRYQELKGQVKIWIGQYDKNEFCELMKKGKLSTHNCPVYYKLLKDKPCDHNCINCWGKIYDKLKERINYELHRHTG